MMGGLFMKIYFLETGVLLDEQNAEYEAYSDVYDKKHGFYDECQKYMLRLDEAIREAEMYVQSGVENTYAIISVFEEDCSFTEDELDDMDLPDNGYSMEDVLFSIVKKEKRLVRNFLEKP